MLQTFVDLCRQPVAAYLDRFDFRSPLLKSMYAVTDGFSGLNGSWQSPGTGMNFLMHNMVRIFASLFPSAQHAIKRLYCALRMCEFSLAPSSSTLNLTLCQRQIAMWAMMGPH